jgi:hypothetical protein
MANELARGRNKTLRNRNQRNKKGPLMRQIHLALLDG